MPYLGQYDFLKPICRLVEQSNDSLEVLLKKASRDTVKYNTPEPNPFSKLDDIGKAPKQERKSRFQELEVQENERVTDEDSKGDSRTPDEQPSQG